MAMTAAAPATTAPPMVVKVKRLEPALVPLEPLLLPVEAALLDEEEPVPALALVDEAAGALSPKREATTTLYERRAASPVCEPNCEMSCSEIWLW